MAQLTMYAAGYGVQHAVLTSFVTTYFWRFFQASLSEESYDCGEGPYC